MLLDKINFIIHTAQNLTYIFINYHPYCCNITNILTTLTPLQCTKESTKFKVYPMQKALPFPDTNPPSHSQQEQELLSCLHKLLA